MIKISTVTPIYNSAEYISQLVIELDKYKTRCINLDTPFQLIESIFVLDEPIDNSAQLLHKLQLEYSFLREIELEIFQEI